jgi:Neurotransmitter-gated ion-channel ligand binding domain
LNFKKFIHFSDLSYGTGSCHSTSCLVESNGTVTCVEPCSFVSHCNANYKFWPFDSQNCTMQFGPWMNAEKELDYKDKDSYISSRESQTNSQWKLKSTKGYKKVSEIKGKNGNPSTYIPSINYFFLIERHSAIIVKLLTGNIMILITLNLLSLLIRPDRKERLILLATSSYLHFQVIHQMSWIVPKNGDEAPLARKLVFLNYANFFNNFFHKQLYFSEIP